MPLPSLSQIKAANAKVNDNGYLLLTVTRPIGPYLAWLWLRLGLTPRQINYASIVFGIALLCIAAAGGEQNLVLATGLCFLWQAIDVSDGTMARALGLRDNFGGFVDYASGMLLVAFLPLCIGVGVYQSPDGSLARLISHFLPDEVRIDEVTFVAIGGAISTISLYMRLINRVLQIRFGDSLSESGAGAGTGVVRWLREGLKNVETIGGVQAVVFFAGAVFSVIELVLAAYFLIYMVLLVAFAGSVYRGYQNRRAYL